MKNVKTICSLAMGIALYVVLGMAVKIPLIGHIQTDIGYIAFGVFISIYGAPAAVVGVVGCLIESMIVSGWVPIGWMLGQTFIGIVMGIFLKRGKTIAGKQWILTMLLTAISMFFGIGIIKTFVECRLYSIPFEVKFLKNSIATVADIVPMIVGIFVAERIKKERNVENGRSN